MKNVLKAFGIIAVVALIGFSMVACDDPSSSGVPAPSGVSAYRSGNLRAYVSWNGVSGADYYQIYTSTSRDGTYYATSAHTYGTSAYVTFNYSGTYYFRVTAIRNGRESARSSSYDYAYIY